MLDDPAPQIRAEIICDSYQGIDKDEIGQQLVFQEEADGDVNPLTQATGADKSQNRSSADIHFPAVERIGDELRQDLRRDAQSLKNG